MKNILVTGGCGFIGSHFIRYLLNRYPDYQVVNLDKLTYCGNPDNLKDIAGERRYRFVQGDIGDPELVDGLLSQDIDCIVNFAAHTHVDRSIAGGLEFVQTNVYGTSVLLESAHRVGIRRFLQISTDEVYGSVETGKSSESSVLAPNSPYAASKAAADLLCRSYFVTHALEIVIVRSANNFGPFQYPEKIIPLFITNILEDKKIPLYGTGKNIRDWLYVQDNCRAIDLVLHRGNAGEIYNIGAGNEMTNLELSRSLLESLGTSEEYIEFVADRPGHDLRYSLDFSKIRGLGWSPKNSFAQDLAYTIEWYRQNRWWWEKLKAADSKNIR
ncbi:MAG: dTDP-glucose 4,6-dehydratase [Candidatus Omnitrophica bacterium]|nr:dTDP-glucose 4,6-dehydratase [Candidatus Omnitrophota bacterium]